MKVKDLCKKLEENGWTMARDNGSHKIFKKEGSQEDIVVNGYGRDEVPKGTLSEIRRQSGLLLR